MPRSPDPANACAPLTFAPARDPNDMASGGDQDLQAALRRIDRLVAQQAYLEQEVLQLREANGRAVQRAYHDALTGLPNRRLLHDRFAQALALAMRERKQVALVFLDLDAFKRVNDVLGHPVGDRLLQQVAARLSACIRASDTACRYGGDEFVVLLPNLDDAQSAVVVARKILGSLAAPYCVEGRPIAMATSIGVAFYPVDGTEWGTLMSVADRAMYRDKGRERVDGPFDRDRPFRATYR